MTLWTQRVPFIHSKSRHDQIDDSSNEIGGRKDNESHPRHRKMEQPVAHIVVSEGICALLHRLAAGFTPGGVVRFRCKAELQTPT